MNPWMDPGVSHPDGVRFVLETGALYGTPARRSGERVVPRFRE
jgi:hypothetical protein